MALCFNINWAHLIYSIKLTIIKLTLGSHGLLFHEQIDPFDNPAYNMFSFSV